MPGMKKKALFRLKEACSINVIYLSCIGHPTISISVCSHEEIDVTHPEFFSNAKLNGYVPPNVEVIPIDWH